MKSIKVHIVISTDGQGDIKTEYLYPPRVTALFPIGTELRYDINFEALGIDLEKHEVNEAPFFLEVTGYDIHSENYGRNIIGTEIYMFTRVRKERGNDDIDLLQKAFEYKT